MIEKYMNILKKDIETIIYESKAITNYVYGRKGTLLGVAYQVILKNGLNIYISIDSNMFPEFDINDIIYIRKRFWCDYNYFYKYIDTEVGPLYIEDDIDYNYIMIEKFNVKEEFNTGCYE